MPNWQKWGHINHQWTFKTNNKPYPILQKNIIFSITELQKTWKSTRNYHVPENVSKSWLFLRKFGKFVDKKKFATLFSQFSFSRKVSTNEKLPRKKKNLKIKEKSRKLERKSRFNLEKWRRQQRPVTLMKLFIQNSEKNLKRWKLNLLAVLYLSKFMGNC